MKVSEIREMDGKTIESKVAELRKQYFDLKMQKKTTGIEKPHMLKDIKSSIARCLTVLGEKKN